MMATRGSGASFTVNSNAVAELTSVTNSITGDSLDITTFDSNNFREFIQGLVSGQVSISGYYDPTDTNGQVVILGAILAANNITSPEFLVDGTNGIGATSGVVTSVDIGAEVAGLVSFSANIQLSGTISVVS